MALRVVEDETKPVSCQIADGIRAMAERAIAEGAVAFLACWESKGKITLTCEPNIVTLMDGMQRAVWDLHQGSSDE